MKCLERVPSALKAVQDKEVGGSRKEGEGERREGKERMRLTQGTE